MAGVYSGLYVAGSDGRLIPTPSSQVQDEIVLTSGSHYAMPSCVHKVLMERLYSQQHVVYTSQKPPKFSGSHNDREKFVLLETAWLQVLKRKVGRKPRQVVDPKTGLLKGWGLKPSTLLESISVLEKHSIAPMVWFWWCWDRDEFRFFKRGLPSKEPVRSLLMNPRRVGLYAEYCRSKPDDRWKKDGPKFEYAEKRGHYRGLYELEIQAKRPLTAEDATKVLDAVLPKSEYDQILTLANKQVTDLMAAEARNLASGHWVWG